MTAENPTPVPANAKPIVVDGDVIGWVAPGMTGDIVDVFTHPGTGRPNYVVSITEPEPSDGGAAG